MDSTEDVIKISGTSVLPTVVWSGCGYAWTAIMMAAFCRKLLL